MFKYRWIFYYIFIFLFLVFFGITIYLIHFFVIKNQIWYSIGAILIVFFSTSSFNLFLLFQKRRQEAKISWLIACSIFPIIGPILYVFLGRKYLSSQKMDQYFFQYRHFISYEKNSEIVQKIPKLSRNLLLFSSNYFLSPIKEFEGELLVDGHKFFQKLFEDIKKAKKFIFIDIYVIKNDFVWQKLKKLLIKKTAQGVKVRILVDSFGAYLIKSRQWLELRRKKIEVIFFNIFKVPFISGDSFYRNHRKMYLIDGEIVYTGGNNISEEYTGFDKYYGYWMDLNLRLEGEIVKTYCENFIFHWSKWGKKSISKAEIASFCQIKKPEIKSEKIKNRGVVIQSGPNIDVSLIEGFILKQIYSARRNIKIFTPYFVPTQKIVDSLRDVLLAEIEVEIYLPGRADSKIINNFNNFFAKKLLKKGAKIYYFNEIFFHGKSIIIDNSVGMIGSANLDARSLFFQYEINLFFSGRILDHFLQHIQVLKQQKVIIETKKIQKVFFVFRFFIFFLKTIV
ncbi:phospholipase D-like domain-containing protein [Mycoplasma sp. 'Moose RK']|uniref:phospholipase D-like domain-containing protein n=1 Tax=Mycoplasma sp. 'Moose RK' TaxID=2780095 RepID=UPI0018C1F6CA|nr:phospholipase D-like domain-containing protein [Mycoplasma sp. 'Moose RK']MBG0730499.1 PLDc N-terminal domain-containing protein [Mycoplasma sp. 'Moose RK']